MNNPELMVVLLIGVVLMCIPISLQMQKYGHSSWKSIVVSIMLVFTGIYGSKLWFFVENLSFRGRSLYGAIFLAPLVFFPIARLLHIPYGETMDFVAPAGCLTLSMVKIQCLRDGCCTGMVLYLNENYEYVKFPSQIVEMVVFFVIAAILFVLSLKKCNRTKVFAWFLILYGMSRFVLDFFRGNTELYFLGLTAGSFWSLCAFVAGIVIILVAKRITISKEK